MTRRKDDGRTPGWLGGQRFGNTQHPATHNPRWRRLGPRGPKKVLHRSCDLCTSYIEYRNAYGRWVREYGPCQHR